MKRKLVSLALQGGGSHGAFTWGVLDRLLEDERIEIEALSGASAGAMNAVALAHGYTLGGRAGAREALRAFWDSVAHKAPIGFLPNAARDLEAIESLSQLAPAISALLSLTRLLAPIQLNPFDVNPLRHLVKSQIDFERLRSDCPLKLFIATTRVSTGALRLFRTHELSLEVLLASACLPTIHHSIDIDSEAYWDGGFTANPPVTPLLHDCRASDIILVLLRPTPIVKTPLTLHDISMRLTEIGFNASLSTELRGIAMARKHASRGWFGVSRLERRLRALNTHVIEDREFMGRLAAYSKLNTNAMFIQALFAEGRKQADAWLEAHYHDLGHSSSLDLDQFMA